MSSAMNHAMRSHRSYAKHKSAMNGQQRTAYIKDLGRMGGGTTPLINRLSALRQKVLEHRKAKEAENGE